MQRRARFLNRERRGVRAVRRAYLAASIRPGFVKALRIEFGDINLSDVVDIDLIKKEYPSDYQKSYHLPER